MLVAFSNVKLNHYTPYVACSSYVIKSKEYIRMLEMQILPRKAEPASFRRCHYVKNLA
jgi:hypothetical protein